jgi:hypothetical protein
MRDSLKPKIVILWKEGKSQSEIAEDLGITRNAVAGHVDRLRRAGVEMIRRTSRYFSDYALANGFVKDRVRSARKRAAPKRQVRVSLPKPVQEVAGTCPHSPAPPPFRHIKLLDLKRRQCRFPLDDGTFCGRQAKGSWCPYHREICYRPINRVSRYGELTRLAKASH